MLTKILLSNAQNLFLNQKASVSGKELMESTKLSLFSFCAFSVVSISRRDGLSIIVQSTMPVGKQTENLREALGSLLVLERESCSHLSNESFV